MNESDARGQADLCRGSRNSVFLGCVWRCRLLEMSVFRGVLRSSRTERMRTKVSDGWSRDKKVLVREVKVMNQLMIMNMRRKMLMRICIEGIPVSWTRDKIWRDKFNQFRPIRSRSSDWSSVHDLYLGNLLPINESDTIWRMRSNAGLQYCGLWKSRQLKLYSGPIVCLHFIYVSPIATANLFVSHLRGLQKWQWLLLSLLAYVNSRFLLFDRCRKFCSITWPCRFIYCLSDQFDENRVSAITSLSTIGDRLKCTQMNGPMCTAPGYPWWSPIQVPTKVDVP